MRRRARSGNRRDVAQRIGLAVFSTHWSAQVTQISANQLGSHLIVGIRMWGVKFHHPITRDEFVGEVVTLVQRTFAAAPATEEIDVWASVPIAVAKGAVVSGDLAKPTSRTVFSLTVRRSEIGRRRFVPVRAPPATAFSGIRCGRARRSAGVSVS